jgi:hypothetical protein
MTNNMKGRSRATEIAASRPDPNALVPHNTVLPLDPEALHAHAEAPVRALLAGGESANTMRSYAGALRYWVAWFRLRYRVTLALPLPVLVVLQFLISYRFCRRPIRCGSWCVASGGRMRRAGPRPASKQALMRGPFEAMLATCTAGLIGIRDRPSSSSRSQAADGDAPK